MAKSNLSLSLLAAAVVAAVVSFGVGRLTAGDAGTAAPADGRVAALERQLAVLAENLKDARAEAAAAQALATTAQSGVKSLEGSMQGGMQANTAKVTAIENAQTALRTAFDDVKAKYEELNGRIEGNRAGVFQLKKRIEKLEDR